VKGVVIAGTVDVVVPPPKPLLPLLPKVNPIFVADDDDDEVVVVVVRDDDDVDDDVMGVKLKPEVLLGVEVSPPKGELNPKLLFPKPEKDVPELPNPDVEEGTPN
jgi:hypothetical protein